MFTFTAYVVVTLLAVGVNAWAVTLDFTRAESAINNVTTVGAPTSWLFPLGVLKAAGALGLLMGIGVPWIGVVAGVGLVLFFAAAIVAHLRVRWYSTIPFPAGFLLLAAGSLALRLATA
jgi:hypothetical protein